MKIEQFLRCVCVGSVMTFVVYIYDFYVPLGKYFIIATLVITILCNLLVIELNKVFTNEQ